jgi:hypothetical protein
MKMPVANALSLSKPSGTTMEEQAPPLKEETVADDSSSPEPSSPPSSSHPKPSDRVKSLKALLALLALVAVILTPFWVIRRQKYRASCRELQRGFESYDLDWNDADPFYLSVVAYPAAGTFYSYKKFPTNETKGPKLLIMQDSWSGSSTTGAFSHSASQTPELKPGVDLGADGYRVAFSIGKNTSDGTIVWDKLDENDGSVTIDPTVVFVRFSNNATVYEVTRDTVFLASYATTNSKLHVERRDIDLSKVTSSCGVKQLLDKNGELSAFYSAWK